MNELRPGAPRGEPEGDGDPAAGAPAQFAHDQELLARHREGDSRAFGELFERYRGAAFSLAYKYTNSEPEAEDIVLEAFTRILETMSGGKGPLISMGHYLRSAVRSAAIRLREKTSKETPNDPTALGVLADEMWQRETSTRETGADGDWLVRAFNGLDEQQQTVLWLRVVEGIPSVEIARELSITPVAATRKYKRAILDLRGAFIDAALDESRDLECRRQRQTLRKLLKHPDEQVSSHVGGCSRCQAIVSRLRLGERALLAGVIVAGGLGITLVPDAPPAAASSAAGVSGAGVRGGISGLGAGVSVPTIVWLIIAATVVAGAGVWIAATPRGGAVLNGAGDEQRTREVMLGESPRGEAHTLFRLGACEVERRPSGDHREIWSLNERSNDCQVTLVFHDEDATLIDTRHNSRLTVAEVAVPGTYWLRLDDGTRTKVVWITATY